MKDHWLLRLELGLQLRRHIDAMCYTASSDRWTADCVFLDVFAWITGAIIWTAFLSLVFMRSRDDSTAGVEMFVFLHLLLRFLGFSSCAVASPIAPQPASDSILHSSSSVQEDELKKCRVTFWLHFCFMLFLENSSGHRHRAQLSSTAAGLKLPWMPLINIAGFNPGTSDTAVRNVITKPLWPVMGLISNFLLNIRISNGSWSWKDAAVCMNCQSRCFRNNSHTLVLIWGRVLPFKEGISLWTFLSSLNYGGLRHAAKWPRRNLSSSAVHRFLSPEYTKHFVNNNYAS